MTMTLPLHRALIRRPSPLALLFVFLVLPLAAIASQPLPQATAKACAGSSLPTAARQGALVIALIKPKPSKVSLDGKPIRVDECGRVVFGIARDAAGEVSLEVTGSDGRKSVNKLAIEQADWAIERVSGLPPKTVSPPPAIAARIAREQAAVGKARTVVRPVSDWAGGFSRPVTGGRISGVFGSQRIRNGVPGSPHYGLDMAVPTGTPIRATAAGVVSFANKDLYLTGGTVLIDHGDGLNSSYLHMSRVDVEVGQGVEQGDVIGAVGATGRATGPHLHFGLNWYDVRVDPRSALEAYAPPN